MPNKEPYENRAIKNGNKQISDSKNANSGQEETSERKGISDDFSQLNCDPSTEDIHSKLAPKGSPKELQEFVDLLEAIRAKQLKKERYNPQEGLIKLRDNLNDIMRAQDWKIAVPTRGSATKFTLTNDYLTLSIGGFGNLQLQKLKGPIKLITPNMLNPQAHLSNHNL